MNGDNNPANPTTPPDPTTPTDAASHSDNPFLKPFVSLSARERRGDNRRPVQKPARVTIHEGPLANSSHEVMTRDLSSSGLSFLLRDSLPVGATCRVDLEGASYICEVVRSRPLSNGKFEMAVQFRKTLKPRRR